MAFKIETSNQDTTFWYEFIELYRNIPILWSDAHENKPKHLRDRALNILLRKYRERDAAAGVREIKQLLKDFRLAYRTELKLALEHTYATGNSLSNYRSALWYFEALSFLESKELRTLKLHSGLTGDNSGIVIDTSFSTIDDSFSCINNYDDEIVLYCKSLVPALKRLPPQQLMYAKYHIDNVVKWGRSGILTYDRPHIDADGSKKSSGAVNVENCTEVLTTQNDISVPPKRLKVDQHNSDDANHATTSLAYDMCKHISMPSEECLVVIDVSENDIEQLKLASVDNEFDHLSFETSSPTYARPDGISDSDRIIHLEISHSNLEDGADPHEMADPHETTLKNAEPVLELTLRRQCTMHFSHYIRNVVPKYSDEEFLRQFRIGRKAVQMICNHLETTSAYKKLRGHGGYEAISPQTHVLSFLWFLGHDKTSYRDVATQFNLSVSCLHSVICRVADAILSMKHILMIPLSEARKTASDIAFSKKCNFSGVIALLSIGRMRWWNTNQD
ncbi:uncharacterized protein LOC120894325 isoform X2 [Anopheles arabiensis]|uniref:uncharacterized protein LOC120894325 isoform X2 n=1 Tax=Anopheles arabiensis TaxID=7173 RepID=UPI001AAE14BE|nr:uncharacterized protein LOC120894325 isoform X2 [Anopheles arabiensis]